MSLKKAIWGAKISKRRAIPKEKLSKIQITVKKKDINKEQLAIAVWKTYPITNNLG